MSCFYSAGEFFKKRFGGKVYKLALSGGFTCPNRDGTLGNRGCIFCSEGSGDFSSDASQSVGDAIAREKERLRGKVKDARFIAYFQSYTCTYGPLEKLRKLYSEALSDSSVVALCIGTRPDCLEQPVVELLKELNLQKPVFVELGLQTIHEKTAAYIRRGYPLSCFEDAVKRLKAAGLSIIVHMIVGLPGESEEEIYQTADYLAHSDIDGIKFQLLHVLKGTDLAEDYAAGKFDVLSKEDYFRIVGHCLELMPDKMVIHRITGDGSKSKLIAPLWSADKKAVLNGMNRYFENHDIKQGRCYK